MDFFNDNEIKKLNLQFAKSKVENKKQEIQNAKEYTVPVLCLKFIMPMPILFIFIVYLSMAGIVEGLTLGLVYSATALSALVGTVSTIISFKKNKQEIVELEKELKVLTADLKVAEEEFNKSLETNVKKIESKKEKCESIISIDSNDKTLEVNIDAFIKIVQEVNQETKAEPSIDEKSDAMQKSLKPNKKIEKK